MRLRARLFRLCLLASVGMFEGSAHAQEAANTQGVAATFRPWRFDLTAGGTYDDNVRFTPSSEAAVSGRLHAGLTRLLRSPRANLTLGAAGQGTVYRQFGDLNRIDYSASLSLVYLVSPRTTLRIGDTFSKTDTADSELLLGAGLFLPRSASRSNGATLEASHQVSPRWSWTLSAQHQVVDFDSDLAIGGSTLGGSAAVSWTAAPEFPVGLSYALVRTSRQGRQDSDTHGATLRADRRFGQTLSVRLGLGLQKVLSPGIDVSPVVLTGTAGFAIRTTKQTVDLALNRSVSEAFGLGRLQRRSAASLGFSRTLTPRLTLGLDASLSRSEDPGGDRNLTFDARSISGRLGIRLADNVQVLAAGGHRGFDPTAAGRTHSRYATLALRVGQNW